MKHTAKVVVRVICSFDISQEVDGTDLALAELAAQARDLAVGRVAAALEEHCIATVKGAGVEGTVRRVHASLEFD